MKRKEKKNDRLVETKQFFCVEILGGKVLGRKIHKVGGVCVCVLEKQVWTAPKVVAW